MRKWLRELFCDHNWQPSGSPTKYVGAFVHSSNDVQNYITRQGFRCKKCGKWKLVERRYGFYA